MGAPNRTSRLRGSYFAAFRSPGARVGLLAMVFALFVCNSPLCAQTDKPASGPLDQQQIDSIAERVGEAISGNQNPHQPPE